jgi:hypothetical protein
LFGEICEEQGAEFSNVLYYSRVRWLSRGKVLKRVVCLREEIYLFLVKQKHPLAHKLRNNDWVAKVLFYSDFFSNVKRLELVYAREEQNLFRPFGKYHCF